jgi:hypothetical protein
LSGFKVSGSQVELQSDMVTMNTQVQGKDHAELTAKAKAEVERFFGASDAMKVAWHIQQISYVSLLRPGLDGDIETWRNTGDACTEEVQR